MKLACTTNHSVHDCNFIVMLLVNVKRDVVTNETNILMVRPCNGIWHEEYPCNCCSISLITQGVYTCFYLCMLSIVFVWYVGYVTLTKASAAAQSTYGVLLNCSQNILVTTDLLLCLIKRSVCEIYNITHCVMCEKLGWNLSTSVYTMHKPKPLN